MNIWRRGPLNKNPYYRTAFRITRVPREITSRATVVKMIGQIRKIIGGNPSAQTVQGVSVEKTDINAAEQVLLDPKQRILEELLGHAAEELPLARIRKLAARSSRLPG